MYWSGGASGPTGGGATGGAALGTITTAGIPIKLFDKVGASVNTVAVPANGTIGFTGPGIYRITFNSDLVDATASVVYTVMAAIDGVPQPSCRSSGTIDTNTVRDNHPLSCTGVTTVTGASGDFHEMTLNIYTNTGTALASFYFVEFSLQLLEATP
jgi:hypothetical protein